MNGMNEWGRSVALDHTQLTMQCNGTREGRVPCGFLNCISFVVARAIPFVICIES
jgi:hypothetical protein